MTFFIGDVKLGLAPRVVGTISDKDIPKLSDNSEALKCVDILEIRVDMFKNHSPEYVKNQIFKVKKLSRKPLIATIRSIKEGGYAKIDDDSRLNLFKLVAPLSDATDVEIKSEGLFKKVVALCRKHNKIVIGSYHNFRRTPTLKELSEILHRSKRHGARIVKIATMAKTISDVERLSAFTFKNKNKGIIAISMGRVGLISRIFNPLIGSLLTYAHLGNPAAPGQMAAMDMAEYLRKFSLRHYRLSGKKHI